MKEGGVPVERTRSPVALVALVEKPRLSRGAIVVGIETETCKEDAIGARQCPPIERRNVVMRIGFGSAVGLIALFMLGCGKKESPAPAVTSAAVAAPKPAESAKPVAVAPSVAAPVPSTASKTDDSESAPPTSFSGAEAVKNAIATGLGCEARAKEGWLELLCRKKNGTGGHPKQAVLGKEEDAPKIEADDKGELHVVVPYRDGAATNGTIEWTDTRYNIKVLGTELKLEWDVSLDVQRSCAKLEKEKAEVISKATKTEDPERLTPAEASKFPRFGSCQQAGLGSWALGLRSVSAAGKDDARSIKFELDVVRVEGDGKVTKADFGTIQAKPGGLEVRPLQAYDYDDDGNDELIVPYDVKAVATGVTPGAISAVWSFQGGQIVPYKNFPVAVGGVQVTQLEFDMRPDIGSYEPFIAYLGSDCGAATCPGRLTGPARYARSMPTGEFSRKDPSAVSAITRACPKGALLVVDGNPTRTAHNVACARLQGAEPAKLESELKAKSASFCKGAERCPLLDSLVQFANAKIED